MKKHTVSHPGVIESEAIAAIKQWSWPVEHTSDLEPLMKRIGNARIVMLGEASHGTHEYYAWRTRITQQLIREKGFKIIAVESDWPDCYRINRYIKQYEKSGTNAIDLLRSFNRWPTWMWANWEMVALTEWLYEFNRPLPANKKAGFYGLDVYSLWESMEAILDYLRKTDPLALTAAEEAFHCFEPYRQEEGRTYARAAQMVPELCQTEVVELLKTIRQKMPSYNSDPENVFNAEQNALVTVHAEQYYRAMVKGGPHSWNIRDRHMAETLNRLLEFHGPESKLIVWAHNTHIGDARATDMSADGMINLGELARLDHGEEGVILVGFGSYKGQVIAGRNWGAPMQKMDMPEARKDSWEDLLHRSGPSDKLILTEDLRQDIFIENHFDHRAIGVVYRPAYEPYSNYVPSLLPLRYDAFLYINQTNALYPLHISPDGHQIPETYPFGV